MGFDLKKLGNEVFDASKDALRVGEQFIEDTTDTPLDFFTEPKKEKEIKEEETHIETQKAVNGLKGDVFLINIKEQLKKGFEDFKNKINDVPSLKLGSLGFGLSKEEKEKHIEEAKKEYDELMKILDSYKSDNELKIGFNKVNSKISDWIEKLGKKESNEIVDSVKLSLENLRADMGEITGETKEQIKVAKEKIKEKYKESEEKNEVVSILTDFGVPAGLAGFLAGILAWFGIGKENTGFFSKALAFIKDPLKGAKSLLGFGSDKDEKNTEEKESEEVVETKKGQLKEDGDTSTYINENIEVKIYEKQIKYVKIYGKDYKFNLPDLGEMSFIQNDKDILKIGSKEIDLIKVVESIKEEKDSYLTAVNFNNSEDLKLIKA